MILYKKAQDGAHLDSLQAKWKDNLRDVYLKQLGEEKDYLAMQREVEKDNPTNYTGDYDMWRSDLAKRDSAKVDLEKRFAPLLRRGEFFGKSWEEVNKPLPISRRKAYTKMK